jgi:hypothetical protein
MYVTTQGQQLTAGTNLIERYNGMGCGCGCDSCAGIGLFDSGMDITNWGWTDWLAAGLGLYTVFSLFSTTKRGVSAAKEGVRRGRRRAAKAITGR